MPDLPGTKPKPHQVELYLTDINQLFNSMDPAPFHEKDLDQDAEEFIVSWAQEFPARDPISLVIHLERAAGDTDIQSTVQQAVHHYFEYRAGLTRREFMRLLKVGRTSLIIGLLFLLACFAAREILIRGQGTMADFGRESLTIAGWVAMWRPMEIYLYDWWPLRRRRKIFEKLSRMPVSTRVRTASV